MQCKEINDLVMKYFDGYISELEYEMILKHNEKCTECALEFQVLKEAIGALEELPEVEVPEGFEGRVMEGIKASRAYSVNPKVVLLWLVSLLGLTVFTWNMMSFVVIPYVKESGVLIMAQNLIIYGFTFIENLLRDIVIMSSVLLGKILVVRNVLLRDHITMVTAIVLTFTGASILMINRLKLGED